MALFDRRIGSLYWQRWRFHSIIEFEAMESVPSQSCRTVVTAWNSSPWIIFLPLKKKYSERLDLAKETAVNDSPVCKFYRSTNRKRGPIFLFISPKIKVVCVWANKQILYIWLKYIKSINKSAANQKVANSIVHASWVSWQPPFSLSGEYIYLTRSVNFSYWISNQKTSIAQFSNDASDF